MTGRIVLCPGQGAQKAGMFSAWLDDDVAREFLQQASTVADLDLLFLGTQADEQTLRDTAVAQPLIAALSVAGALSADLWGQPGNTVAGHSLGGLTALGLAGVIPALEVVRLAAVRGRVMAQCAALSMGGMWALVGGEQAQVLEAISQAGMTAANINAVNQVVAAGGRSQAEELRCLLPAGVRMVELAVAGAFHTEAMAGASTAFMKAAGRVKTKALSCDWVDDSTGKLYRAGESLGDVVQLVAAKITQPVRWDLVSETLNSTGLEQAVELPPAGVLRALARRGLPQAKCVPLSGVYSS